MLSPIIRRAARTAARSAGRTAGRSRSNDPRSSERGVTIALVAVSMVAMIGMAALSIDIGTLYQAKAEAQRTADTAALAAARMISISGITGDPNNAANSWQAACGTTGTATLAATAVAQAQPNFVGGVQPSTIKVTYGAGAAATDCSTLVGTSFAVNPIVTVYVQQATLPTFFGRIFGLITGGTASNSGVSATAVAEAYNPSGSGSLASGMVPVQPRCVKPWVVPNIDPDHSTAGGFVSLAGAINSPGTLGSNNGVIGETFNINAACTSPGTVGTCTLTGPPGVVGGILQYVPAFVQNPSSAVPSCSAEANWNAASNYQQAIAGCDQTTVYACGTALGAQVDLTENPVNPITTTGDTATGVACLTNSTVGSDVLTPGAYPFQITPGAGNPLSAQGVTGLITTSNSIVTIPIYPGGALAGAQPQVTIIGFLQVFINFVDGAGNLNVTVMNVSGCSNAATVQPANGSSPVPIRLITQ